MDVRIKGQALVDSQERSSLRVDRELAGVMRKLCRFERCTLDELLDRMLRAWLKHERTDIDLVGDPTRSYERAPRRVLKPATKRQ